MPPGSNRSGDERVLTDRRRKSHVQLPVKSVRVSRRVSSEHVSSYNLRVHAHPNSNKNKMESILLDNRNVDPGEAELEFVHNPYRKFVTESALNRPNELLEGIVRRIDSNEVRALLPAAIGLLIKNDRIGELKNWLGFVDQKNINEINKKIGRSTWRHLVRHKDAESIIPFFGDNDNLLGELALNSNTIYRQDINVLKYILPHIDNILNTVDYVDFGHQQVFSTRSPNLIPSSIYPIKSYGTSQISVAGSKQKFMYSQPKNYNIKEYIEYELELYNTNSGFIHVRPMGLLPKSQVQALKITNEGLINSSISIPWNMANIVLQGFRISNINMDKHTVIYPSIRPISSIKDVEEIRKKLFRLTSRKTTNILNQIKEYGTSGYGEDEIDIYDKTQYKWIKGKRSRALETDILDRLFPHPLIRLLASDYRELNNENYETRDNLCSLLIASLPLISTPK